MTTAPNTQTAQKSQTFLTPFTPAYWKCSIGELASLKSLVLAALFIALRMAIKSFKIPLPFGDNLNIFFTFTVNALGSYIYGPVVGFLSGCVCDTLSYVIAPSGPYNIAFMFVEGLGSFLFGVVLYRAKISAVRLFLSKFFVSLICNVFLTPVFLSTMYGKKTVIALMIPRIWKNLTLLPFEGIILCIIFGAMLPILYRAKALPWLKKEDARLSVL